MTWAAVIGSPISHSLSPALHTAAWHTIGAPDTWEYRTAEVTTDSLASFIANVDEQCLGLSVTMPLKQAIMTHLDVIDPQAQAVGAVNTVIPASGILTGFNTDIHGIITAIRQGRLKAGLPMPAVLTQPSMPHQSPLHLHEAATAASPMKALILGGRASASSAIAALGSIGVTDISIAARRMAGPDSAFMAATRLGVTCQHIPWQNPSQVVQAINEADIVISTMPAGVTDEIAQHVQPKETSTLLDIVYSPWHTPLVERWHKHGGHTVHGTDMLLHQAAMQVRLMSGKDPDVDTMKNAMLAAHTNRSEQ